MILRHVFPELHTETMNLVGAGEEREPSWAGQHSRPPALQYFIITFGDVLCDRLDVREEHLWRADLFQLGQGASLFSTVDTDDNVQWQDDGFREVVLSKLPDGRLYQWDI